jgi:hypothetical protein
MHVKQIARPWCENPAPRIAEKNHDQRPIAERMYWVDAMTGTVIMVRLVAQCQAR